MTSETKQRRALRRRPFDVVQHLAQSSAPRPELGHPLLAAHMVLATGSVVHATHVMPSWFAAVGGIAIVVCGMFAFTEAIDRLSAFYAACVCAAIAGWLSWVADTTPWSGISFGILALELITLGPFYGLVRSRRMNRHQWNPQIEGQKKNIWVGILHQAGARDIRIARERSSHSVISMDLVLGPASPDFRALTGLIPSIERIAAHTTGLPIRSGSIQIEAGNLAHQATMVIPTRDVLSEVIPYPTRTEPRSIHDPLSIGQYVDGSDIEVYFRSIHGLFAGMNDSGKSGSLNVHIVELTRCVDNVTWYIAGNKAVRGLAPWLLPWLREEVDQPVFDWVAGSLDEAMRMLLDAYRAVDGRQGMFADGADKWTPTSEKPQISIVIDESPDLFATTKRFRTHKGESVTFSEIVLKLLRLARSEAIQLIILSQRGTATMLGPDGGDLKSQIAYRLGFRATGNMTDVNAVFASDTIGIELARLPNGAVYVEQKGYTRPRLGKGFWLEPERIKQVAITNAAYVGAVDQSTADFMTDYSGRWTRPEQQELLDTIAGRKVSNSQERAKQPEASISFGSLTMEEVNETLRIPQSLIDAADAAEKQQRITKEARKDTTLRDQMDALQLELLPRSALPADTLDLIDAIAQSELLSSDDRWITSEAILKVAAEKLHWPDNTEGSRQIAAALRPVEVEPERPSIDGRKVMAYRLSNLKNPVRIYRRDPTATSTDQSSQEPATKPTD